MITFDTPKPSRTSKFFANAAIGIILFFFAFLFFVMIAPVVVDQI